MRPEEYDALRARIDEPDEEIAALFGVPVSRLQEWRAGTARIPRYPEQMLRFLAESAERGRALDASGLEACAWMAEFDETDLPDDPDALQAAVRRAEEHHATCALCQARQRFIDARFGPMPPLPMPGWMHIFAAFGRVPTSLRPAAVGAAVLAAIVSLRAVVAIPAIIAKPAMAVELLVAILSAAAAGASGGFAFTLVRPTFKRLGRPGDYLTGIVCVGAYLTSLALVAPIAFGEPLLERRADWIALGIGSLLFGSVVGHSWFGPTERTN